MSSAAPSPHTTTTSDTNEDCRFSLDSTYLVAFEMAHQTFKRGLAQASSLNITQYRFLSKLCQATGPISQAALSEVLGLKPNTASQTVDVLQHKGLVTRVPGVTDARTRVLEATEAGRAHVALVNDALVKALYADFPTDDPRYRTILEAAIYAGSRIERDLEEAGRENMLERPASRALVAVELIRQETERVLKETAGASMAECRIVQKLAEAGRPLRLRALADALLIPAISATRTVDKLVERSWCQRLKSPHDRKAVYVGLTDEGQFQANLIEATINELAQNRLWVNLNPHQREAIEQMGHIVIAGIQAQREAEEQELLSALSPE